MAASPGLIPAGANLDDHLTLAGCRHFDSRQVQHVAVPVTVEPHSARRCSRHVDLLTARIETFCPAPEDRREPAPVDSACSSAVWSPISVACAARTSVFDLRMEGMPMVLPG